MHGRRRRTLHRRRHGRRAAIVAAARGRSRTSASRASGRRRKTTKRRRYSRRSRKSVNRVNMVKTLAVDNFHIGEEGIVLQVPAIGSSQVQIPGYATGSYSSRATYVLQLIFQGIYNNSGSTLGAQGGYKFFLMNSTIRYKWVNNSNGNCFLEAYFLRARKDIPNTESSSLVTNIMQQGFVDNGYPYSASNMPPTLTPFNSLRLTSWFNIYKVKKMVVPGGGTGTLSVKSGFKVMRLFNIGTQSAVNQQPSDYTLDYSHLKGAKCIIFRAVGQPADNITGPPGPGAHGVGATQPLLDFIIDYKYTWRHFDDPSASTNVFLDKLQVPVSQTITTEFGQTQVPEANA